MWRNISCLKDNITSYIEARYNKDFSISQEQLEYLISRIDILKDITERLCKKKIVEYDMMTE